MIYLSDDLEQANAVSYSQPICITAKIDTALCIGAGGHTGSLSDKPIVRTADGNLMIPASQLKGRLRHECEKLLKGLKLPICESPRAETMCPERAGLTENFGRDDYRVEEYPDQHHCLICQIFGNPTLPSRIWFDDLLCEAEARNLPEVLRPGVSINRARRTAEEKRFYLQETSPANLKLPFSGEIYLQSDCPPWATALLAAAFQHLHALGGSKSAGLGWVQWEIDALRQQADINALKQALAATPGGAS